MAIAIQWRNGKVPNAIANHRAKHENAVTSQLFAPKAVFW